MAGAFLSKLVMGDLLICMRIHGFLIYPWHGCRHSSIQKLICLNLLSIPWCEIRVGMLSCYSSSFTSILILVFYRLLYPSMMIARFGLVPLVGEQNLLVFINIYRMITLTLGVGRSCALSGVWKSILRSGFSSSNYSTIFYLLVRQGIPHANTCSICGASPETAEHILFECPYALSFLCNIQA